MLLRSVHKHQDMENVHILHVWTHDYQFIITGGLAEGNQESPLYT